MTSEDIIIRMGLDARPVTVELRKVRRDFTSFREDLKKLNPMSVLKSGLGKLGVGLGIGALASGAIAGAKAALAFAKEITHLKDETDLTGTTIQAFSMRVSKTGGDTEVAEHAMQKFAVAVGEARMGTKEATDKFDKLGISLKDASGHTKSTNQLFADYMDAIKAAQDPTVQAAMASDLLGEKIGVKVVNALKEGSKAFEEFKQKASFKILSDDELERLNAVSHAFAGIFGYVKAFAGHALVKISAPFFSDADELAKLARSRDTDLGPGFDARMENAKRIAEVMTKLDKVRRDIAFENLDAQGKVKFLMREQGEIAEKIHNSENGSVQQTE